MFIGDKTMITLLLCALSWLPTVNEQRVGFGYQEPPYWLGVSMMPNEVVNVQAFVDGEELFRITHGTDWKLAWIDSYEPVEFYEDGKYVGQIVPEPLTAFLFGGLYGCFGLARKRHNATR